MDRPKPGFSNSTDSNTARSFFENPEISACVTGLDRELIERFRIVRIAIYSGFRI